MNVVIIGGGISGLLAAHQLSFLKPVLLEHTNRLGGTYTAGGLKYIRKTEQFEELLKELSVPFVEYQPRGALLYESVAWPHPEWLNSVSEQTARDIQAKHWLKTRHSLDGFTPTCMNDPQGEGADPALKCDHGLLLDMLARQATVKVKLNTAASEIHQDKVVTSNGVFPYDKLIVTAPLWVTRNLAPWANLPTAEAGRLLIMDFRMDNCSNDLGWDYIYTPFAKHVTRITNLGNNRFQAEMPLGTDGAVSPVGSVEDVMDNIQDVMPHRCVRGWDEIRRPWRVIPGHLRPPNGELRWPSTWLPLGRFAAWKPRETAEKVLANVQELAADLQNA